MSDGQSKETQKTLNLELLKAPFPPHIVSWRVGSTTADKTKGMALAYIDARDVMERLDEVCGSDGWQCDYAWSDGKKLCCRVGIKVGSEWVWKSNGAGETDFEGDKGAFSDAFKRAAVLWGIGRYLYDVKAPWMPIKAIGKSFVFTDEALDKLARSLPVGPTAQPKVQISAQTKRDVYIAVMDAVHEGDDHGLRQVWDEWSNEDKVVLWQQFNSQERAAIKQLLGDK